MQAVSEATSPVVADSRKKPPPCSAFPLYPGPSPDSARGGGGAAGAGAGHCPGKPRPLWLSPDGGGRREDRSVHHFNHGAQPRDPRRRRDYFPPLFTARVLGAGSSAGCGSAAPHRLLVAPGQQRRVPPHYPPSPCPRARAGRRRRSRTSSTRPSWPSCCGRTTTSTAPTARPRVRPGRGRAQAAPGGGGRRRRPCGCRDPAGRGDLGRRLGRGRVRPLLFSPVPFGFFFLLLMLLLEAWAGPWLGRGGCFHRLPFPLRGCCGSGVRRRWRGGCSCSGAWVRSRWARVLVCDTSY